MKKVKQTSITSIQTHCGSLIFSSNSAIHEGCQPLIMFKPQWIKADNSD